MDKQIFDLLTDLSQEIKSMKTDIHDFKTDMHNRFDTIEAKLEGVGQFELTNESRIIDVDFIADKVSKLERELYILKNNRNN
ncbi:hypothetical protein [Alkalihalobacterium chitinilyticum]|uniref:Uncharacterized protein n=1 Tax=Alkalihalobacterium chitinilyticum TaxID=2980103 RepID=A0ABT5VLP2_9BACI|nr:hypothetical protein [Alkalihalobacterium chitinilyticum]MDE5416344.1 hypothetical protein [Alkalihalobacterium chitinilyticum]